MIIFAKFLFLLLLKETLCFCEESHVVICDDLSDLKDNETWTWRFVSIGSNDFKHEVPKHTLNLNDLHNFISTTIIYQVNVIKPYSDSYSVNRIEYLNLYDNEVAEIEDYTFANMASLRFVFLEKNQIHHLGRGIFENSSLEMVSLSRNNLRSVRTCFYRSKIKWLKMNHNKITFINRGSFPSNLEILEMDHNLLATLDANSFENLKLLKELSIKHNRLTALPNIVPLAKIEYLHLSYNKIGSFHYPFDNHKNLSFLDLSSNLIRNFDVDTVSSDVIPPLVLIMFNRLTNLNFVHPSKRTDLAYFGNPLICDCYFTIKRTIAEYKHLVSCDYNFDKGKLPVCIEYGKCEEKDVKESDIENFVNAVNECEKKDYCVFRL